MLATLEAGEQAARAAQEEARRVLYERRKADLKAKGETLRGEWDERLKSLKQKLGAA